MRTELAVRAALRLLGPVLALFALWLLCGVGVAWRTIAEDSNGHAGHALWLLLSGSWDAGSDPWSFFSFRNQSLILAQSAIVTVAACGMTLIIVAGGIDLSVGSVIALTGVAAALVLRDGGGPVAALAVAMLVGAVAGAVNGAVSAGLRIMPFIVTLGTLGIARGLAKWLADNQTVNLGPSWLDALMQPYPTAGDPWLVRALGVAPGVWIAALIAVGSGVLLARSVFGRHLYAIGSNPAAARLCGVRVRTTQTAAYVVAGALFGLAGLLETAKLHQGDPTTASGRELDVIAAVVIGGASLSGGTGSIIGAVVGALIMGVLRNGSQQLEWPTYVQEILIGAVIVLAVGLDRLRRRE